MYEYRARIVRVIDGDTVEAEVDLGFHISSRMMLRLFGINTPEIKGSTKPAGLSARDYLQLETAHSMPPESAGSRSPGWRCRGVGVASTGPAQPFFACGVLILPNCRHTLCCTAEWWRRECAGEAGRSRRLRQWRVSGAGSTRFHQTEMVRPAVGAATTERWSVR